MRRKTMWSVSLVLFLLCGLFSTILPTAAVHAAPLGGNPVLVSLSSYLNNEGIGSQAGQGNFDGANYGYPANQVPAGGQVTLGNVAYQFPANTAGTNDNVVALGQVVPVTQGQYQQISLLVAASFGPANGTLKLQYTDTSTSSIPMSVPDWYNGGPNEVVTTTYRYTPVGTDGHAVYLYQINVAVNPTKQLAALVLPATTQVGQGQASLHIFALTLLGTAPPATNLYVNVATGNDSNAGTSAAQAFKTLTKAQSAVRTMNTAMSGDINVNVAAGTYPLTSTLNFTSQDSGSNGWQVNWEGVAGSTLLTGGIPISNWSQAGSLYSASVPTSVQDFFEVYVNGERATRSLAPANYNPVGGGVGGITPTGYYYANAQDQQNNQPDGYIVNTSDVGNLQNYRNPGDLDLVWASHWRNHRLPVQSITAGSASGTTNIIMQQPYLTWSLTNDFSPASPTLGNTFAIENAYELVQPGNFYFDRPSHTLYYDPASNSGITNVQQMNAAQVYVPTLDTLLSIQGSSLSNEVQNLSFSGLTFSHTTWSRAFTDGASATQADAYVNGPGNGSFTDGTVLPTAAVHLEYANNVVFDNNTFTHLGGAGLILQDSTSNVMVSDSMFTDISATGIIASSWLQDFLDGAAGVNTNDVIYNNTITTIGVEYWSSAGISAYYNDGLVIEQNTIGNVPWAGITYGWNGWQAGEQDSVTSRNGYIGNNYIYNYVQKVGDSAGIYTLGQQPNTEIANNYIANGNTHSYVAGLYFDEHSAYFYAHNNVIDNPPSVWLYIWTSSIHDIYLNNNYTNTNAITNSGTRITLTNTCTVSGENWSQCAGAQTVIQNAGQQGSLNLATYAPPKGSTATNDVGYGKNATFSYNGSVDYGQAGHPAQFAVSDTANQYAEANNYTAPLQVDLLSNSPINQVNITFAPNLYATSFYVQTSTDNIHWSTVASVSGFGGGTSTNTFATITARYVNIVPLAPNGPSQTGTQMAVSALQVIQQGTLSIPATPSYPALNSSLQSNLQLWLEADKGIVEGGRGYVTKWQDQSGHGNDAVVPPAITTTTPTANNYSDRAKEPLWVPNVINGFPAVNFDGWDDSLLATGVSGNFTNFTVAYMFRPYNTTGQVFKAYGTWGQFGDNADPSTGGVYIGTDLNTRITPTQSGNNFYVPGEWISVIFTMNNGVGTLYKNGVQIAQQSMDNAQAWTGFELGDNVDFRTKDGGNVIDGDVTEVQVYNTGLNTSQVQSVQGYFNTKYGFNPPADEHLALWLHAGVGVNQGNGIIQTWGDQSGSQNNEVSPSSIVGPVLTSNAYNGRPAVTFNVGTNVYPYMQASGVQGSMNQMTIAFNFRPYSLNGGQVFRAAGGWGQFTFHADPAGTGGVYVGTSVASRITPASTGPVLSVNTWTQVEYVFNNGAASLYINGNLIVSTTLSNPASWTGFWLGENDNGSINGDVTDLLLYNTALTSTQVQTVQSYLTRGSGVYGPNGD